MNKREFVKSIAAVSALVLTPQLLQSCFSKPKRALVLGGRNFVGPSIVNIFKNAGWEVTLLNRGKTNPHLFTELPIIICDREKENKEGLREVAEEIKKYQWDCVIDTWQKSPKAVSDFIEEFHDNFNHYHYISTLAVYNRWNEKGIDETKPLTPIPSDFPNTMTLDLDSREHRYAVRKTFAELKIVEKLKNYTIYRAHGIRGYRTPDHSDPMEEEYWPIRFSKGGEIMLPDEENHNYQITDLISLCNFMLHCAENSIFGAFNVAYKPFLFKKYINSIINVTGKPKKMHWVPGAFLIKNGIKPRGISTWRPRAVGYYYFNIQKALNAGLVNRAIEDLIKDQLEGYKSRYPNNELKFGGLFNGKPAGDISEEKEKELIEKWNLLRSQGN